MQPQIVPEVEVHRQYVRLKIPIQVEIDGVRYQVDDWSVGGFGVESVMIARQPGERFPVRMIFPFEEFDMSMRFDVRMVYVDLDYGRFGCAFVGQSREQVAVFRYLVDAFLSGEVVSAGDILQVRARGGAPHDRLPERLPPAEDAVPASGGKRRWIAVALAGLAGLALAGLASQAPLWPNAMRGAVVEAPTVQVRAPAAGRFAPALEPGQRVEPGMRVGSFTDRNERRMPLASPCACVLLEQAANAGHDHEAGKPLITLVEADRPLSLRAQVPLDEAEGLAVGDRVAFRIAGRPEPGYGKVARIDLRPLRQRLRAPDAALPVSPGLAQVIVRPDRQLPLEDFGLLASVRFL